MKRAIALLIGAAGLVAGAHGETTITMLVSTDGVNFSNVVHPQVNTGLRTVEVLAVVSHTGTPVVGLGSFQFQPTISNWGLNGAADALVPWTTSFGSNTSTPAGAVADSPGQYGRISPWAAVSNTSSQRLFGHVNTSDGVSYLRITQAQVTSWIGGVGNTSGGSGVNIKQLSNIGRSATDPAFNSNLVNIRVFRFAVQIDMSTAVWPRVMVVDAPLEGFGNYNSATGQREVYWYADMNEATGSVREVPTVVTASIAFIPSPAGVLGLGLAAVAAGRRRQ